MSIFKNPRPGEAAGAILIATGLIFVAISGVFLMIKDKGMEKLSGSTQGTLVRDFKSKNNTHQPTYKYEVDGMSFECTSSATSSFEPENEALIKYNPSKPDECSSNYDEKVTKILVPIFLAVGGFLNAIGIVSYIASSHKK